MPHLPLAYCRIPQARRLCLSSRKAASIGISGLALFALVLPSEPEGWRGGAISDAFCQFVYVVAGWDDLFQERQDVGRYLPLIVLEAQVHMMLPAWVIGDRMTYWLVG